MPSDRSFELAQKLKKTKLWKKLEDSEIFAVRFSDGETGYCVMMGMLGEHLALAVYPGQAGLDSYRLLADAGCARNEITVREAMLSQECLQCSFENADQLEPEQLDAARAYAKAHGLVLRGAHAFAQFTRYRAGRVMWPLMDEADERRLCEAMEAALDVARRLEETAKQSLGLLDAKPYDREVPLLAKTADGFSWGRIALPPRAPGKPVSPTLRDELLANRLSKAKKNRRAMLCELFMMLSPVLDQEDEIAPGERPPEAPWYPYALLAVESGSGQIVTVALEAHLEEKADSFIDGFARSVLEAGVPAEIRVRDERTRTLLASFAAQAGIRLTLQEELPFLDEIEEGLVRRFSPDGEDDESEEEQLAGLLEMLDEMGDSDIRAMPAPLRAELRQMLGTGIFPPALEKKLRRLL